MSLHPIDGYLLDGSPTKAVAIIAALAERAAAPPAAEPFYRALDAIGVRAADEALIALRLVLREKAPDDDAVRRLRDLIARARRGDAAARAAYCEEIGC
jgi:hypothetical protein